MKLWKKILLIVLCLILVGVAFLYWFITTRDQREYSYVTYQEHCISCHGNDLKGTVNGPSLIGASLKYGADTPALMKSIGELHKDMTWLAEARSNQIKAIALYVSEQRQRYPTIKDSYQKTNTDQTINSKYYQFRVEEFSKLASRPYSIAPMPDGRILVNEKVRGLSIVDSQGRQSALIQGAPLAYEQFASVEGTYLGWGQMLEVALHPQYSKNGWIYLAYTDRCQMDCGSLLPQTMVKVIRGRLADGQWIDQQTIWEVDKEYYTIVPDGVAGGRLAFDRGGYIYISIGGKASYKYLHDMNTPYGKIHRVKDNGVVPEDNPFWLKAGEQVGASTRKTVWSYGHRTTQGLEAHPITGEIWGAEMGPRGGDEVNRIIGGGNYGWPLYTNGLDYDSEEVSIGKDLGLDYPIESTVLPVVDFTPAPALSNLTFHHGQRFSKWKDDILVGSLKAQTLYRLRLENDQLIEKEALVEELGRIRDVEMGYDGLVYIAVEHGDAGAIVRLVPFE